MKSPSERSGSALTEIDHLVLLAVLRCGERAYGVAVLETLRAHAAKRVSRASVYHALHRLEERAYVTSHLSAPSPRRGGRAKRLFTVSDEGLRVVGQVRESLLAMWTNLEHLLDRHGSA